MKKFFMLLALLIPLVGIAQTKNTLSQKMVGTWSFYDEFLEGREMGEVTYVFNADGTGTKHTSEWKQCEMLGGGIVPAKTVKLRWKVEGNTITIFISGDKIVYEHLKVINNKKITGDYYEEMEGYSPVVTFIRK